MLKSYNLTATNKKSSKIENVWNLQKHGHYFAAVCYFSRKYGYKWMLNWGRSGQKHIDCIKYAIDLTYLTVVRASVKLVSQNIWIVQIKSVVEHFFSKWRITFNPDIFSNFSYFEEAGIVHNFAGFFPLVT